MRGPFETVDPRPLNMPLPIITRFDALFPLTDDARSLPDGTSSFDYDGLPSETDPLSLIEERVGTDVISIFTSLSLMLVIDSLLTLL